MKRGKGEPPTGKKKYEKMVYEYSRSASSSISEFALNNSFYVDGRKLTIDQVDLTTAQTARWRLCPSCSHAQRKRADIPPPVLDVEALGGLTQGRCGTC